MFNQLQNHFQAQEHTLLQHWPIKMSLEREYFN